MDQILLSAVPLPKRVFVNRTFLQSQTELLRAQLDEVGCEVSLPPGGRSPPEHNPGLSEHKERGGGGVKLEFPGETLVVRLRLQRTIRS